MKLKSIAAAVTLLAAGAAAHGASASVLLFEDFNSATQGLNWGGNANFNVGSPPGSVDLIGTASSISIPDTATTSISTARPATATTPPAS